MKNILATLLLLSSFALAVAKFGDPPPPPECDTWPSCPVPPAR